MGETVPRKEKYKPLTLRVRDGRTAFTLRKEFKNVVSFPCVLFLVTVDKITDTLISPCFCNMTIVFFSNVSFTGYIQYVVSTKRELNVYLRGQRARGVGKGKGMIAFLDTPHPGMSWKTYRLRIFLKKNNFFTQCFHPGTRWPFLKRVPVKRQ